MKKPLYLWELLFLAVIFFVAGGASMYMGICSITHEGTACAYTLIGLLGIAGGVGSVIGFIDTASR